MLMKLYHFAVVIGLFFLSCNKDGDLVYDFRLQSLVDVPTGLNTLETHYFILRDIPTFYAANLAARGISEEAVTRVNASRGTFTARFNRYNLAFIRLVTVKALSKRPGGKQVEMFYMEDVPFNEDEELQMLSSLGDLEEIMAEESMDLEIRLQFRASPPPGLTLQLDYGYLVQL